MDFDKVSLSKIKGISEKREKWGLESSIVDGKRECESMDSIV